MSIITKYTILEVTGKVFDRCNGFDYMGGSDSSIPNTLCFFDNVKYLSSINQNLNIAGVFSLPDLSHLLRADLAVMETDDPRWDFYTLFNKLARDKYQDRVSEISTLANIHTTAFISPLNVTIGEHTVIGPLVKVLHGEIGRNCVIQAGAVVGSEGFEYKRTLKGILPVYHNGTVIIEDNVDLGANTCVDKGFAHRHTIIKSETKIDNLVHIGHSANIGKRCLIAACAQIGAVNMGNDVWVGPSVNLLSGQNIGDGAYITVGAIVTKDVKEGERVTGNFAVPHEIFLKNLKNILS